MFSLLILIAIYLLAAPLFGMAALRRVNRAAGAIGSLDARIGTLGRQVDDLRREITELRAAGGAPLETDEDQVGVDRAEAAPTSTEPAPEPPEAPEAEPPEPEVEPEPEPPAEPEAELEPAEDQVGVSAVGGPSAMAGFLSRLEESLTQRWLVWLGAVTLALGGVFLIKYSIDKGWLGPAVRTSLGFLMGIALVVAGEWLRRQPLQRGIAAIRPDYVPPALTSAGLFSAFASVYAAYALHDLLSSLLAFVLLAALAAGAVALSLLQGPFIALIGLLGGFLTPMLVSTSAPSAWALFGYLLALIGGGLALVRYTGWWWLGWATLAGAAVWPLLWFVGQGVRGDEIPLGLYMIAVLGLFLLVRRHGEDGQAVVARLEDLSRLAMAERLAWAAALAVGLLLFVFVRIDSYGPASLITLAVFGGALLVVGRREQVFDGLAAVAAVLSVGLIGLWHLPAIVTKPLPLYIIEGRHIGQLTAPILPPELQPFALTAIGFALLFGIGGYLALWGARRPALWASISAAAPVLLLTLAYWRIERFQLDLLWALAAFGLAVIMLAAAAMVGRYRSDPKLTQALGLYAAAVVAAVSLAATMSLEQAWLTVALSLQLPALAWIDDHLELKLLRRVALIVAGTVLTRLVFNWHILDYPLGGPPGLNWILYGYGIPAAAFYWTAKRFRVRADDKLVMVLEAGALSFAVLLVTLEIRNLVAGALDDLSYRMLERSLQSLAWGAIAYGLLVFRRRHERPVLLWGWRILAGLAVGQVVGLQLLVFNPLWSGESVGLVPIANQLFLAFAAPAVLVGLFAQAFRRDGPSWLAALSGVLALVLVFAYVSLELRHLWHGPRLDLGPTGDGEWYAYSVLWLAYAGALLVAGLAAQSASLRYASLAVLLVTVAKVFLFDMSALAGLYRAASFIGLGLSLVGIGLFYQRIVFPPGESADDEEGGPDQEREPEVEPS
jgi:uncharacterized membrane protein